MIRKDLPALLTRLAETKTMSAKECADAYGVSVSTYKNGLGELNGSLKRYGVQIVSRSGRGNGYSLEIYDRDKYTRYLNELLSRRNSETSYASQDKRVFWLIRTFLTDCRFHKSDDMADELGLSRSRFSDDLKLARKEMERFGITLKSVPNYGLKAEGEEADIRACLSYHLLQNEREHFNGLSAADMYPHSVMAQLEKIVLSEFQKRKIPYTAVSIDNLRINLVVAYYRVKAGNIIRYDEQKKEMIRNLPEYELACEIADRIMKSRQIVLPEDEVCCIAVHLTARSIPEIDYENSEMNSLAGQILDDIKDVYQIDLTDDENLRRMLIVHTTMMLKRLQYGTTLTNPMVTDVSSGLLEAYELAVTACSTIRQRYPYVTDNWEIGFYALHFEIALDKKRRKQKKVLLVSADARGNKQLLKYYFEKKFGHMIDSLDVCDVAELAVRDLSGFDVLFSTIRLSDDRLTIPVIRIQQKLTEKNETDIRRILSEQDRSVDIKNVFPPELFFARSEAEDLPALLDEACSHLQGHVRISAGFAQRLRERTHTGRILYGKGILFIPVTDAEAEQTRICITTLKKPFPYQESKVRTVLTGCFAAGETAENSMIYAFLSDLLSDEKKTDALAYIQSYQQFLRLAGTIGNKENE
ncbi:MAG: PRD domain-containing protein [Solobacterium sp.]|nr:PRD domain-containing protein [Solobacterium sp.]